MISLDLSAVIATIAIFLFLVHYLNNFLYKPLISFMDERSNTIKKDEDCINLNSTLINENKLKANEILSNAKKEALEIVKKANIEANANYTKSIEEKKKQLELENQKFISDLNSDEKKLQDSLNKKSKDINILIDNLISRI